MLKKISWLILVTLFISPLLYPMKLIAASQRKVYGVVEINGHQFNVEVADTIFKKQLGLGGRKPLNDNEGMLFPFQGPVMQSFWMKGMLMPIDIIWIKGGRVLGVSENLEPQGKTADFNLKIYRSPGPADNVLEVKAGRAAELRIKIGDKVKINNK